MRGNEFVSSLEGLDGEGRFHRVECEIVPGPRPRAFGGCRWVTNGALVCTCDEPDWGMTSPWGVPLCAGWDRFDFSDVVYEP